MTRSWLSAELDRIWLLGERCLRRCQRAELRAVTSHPLLDDVEATLRARRDGADLDEAALEHTLARATAEATSLRSATPLARLTRALALTELEVEALLIAVAPHIDHPLADLLAVLRGTPTRRGVDPALVGDLLALDRAQRLPLLDVLAPERPLLGWRLLQISSAESSEAYSSASYRAMQPTHDLLALLSGRAAPSPTLERCARLITAEPTLSDLVLERPRRQQLERTARSLAAATGDARAPWLLLWGPAGAGKRTIAARLSAIAGRPLYVFDPTHVDKSAREETLRRAQRDAIALGATLYLGPLRDLELDDTTTLAHRLSSHPGSVLFGVESFQPPRFRCERPLCELEIPLPTEQQRLSLWERGTHDVATDGNADLAQLARGYKLTPGEILESAAEARTLARCEDRALGQRDLRAGVERRMRNELGEAAWRVNVKARWEDLVLDPEDLERVRELIGRKQYADKVWSEWGLGDRIERGLGLIALFSGPPGTGKTMLAGVIAKALGLELYQIDLSQIYSRWVGETEKKLAQIFDQAERAHAVLLFDEVDSLLAKRTDVDSSNDRYSNATVNYLLQRLERYSGVAVLTTNKDAALDEALQRRLTLHLRLEMPDAVARERLWRSFLPPRIASLRAIDFRRLANEFELTGGYIKNVAVRAAFLAAREGTQIDLALLRKAAVLELQDMGRLVMHPATPPEPIADDVVHELFDFLDG